MPSGGRWRPATARTEARSPSRTIARGTGRGFPRLGEGPRHAGERDPPGGRRSPTRRPDAGSSEREAARPATRTDARVAATRTRARGRGRSRRSVVSCRTRRAGIVTRRRPGATGSAGGGAAGGDVVSATTGTSGTQGRAGTEDGAAPGSEGPTAGGRGDAAGGGPTTRADRPASTDTAGAVSGSPAGGPGARAGGGGAGGGRRLGRRRSGLRRRSGRGGLSREEQQRIDVALWLVGHSHPEVHVRNVELGNAARPHGPDRVVLHDRRAASATATVPRWRSVTAWPSAVRIVIVRPPVGTVPANETRPDTGAWTASPVVPPMSIPRCWPARVWIARR